MVLVPIHSNETDRSWVEVARNFGGVRGDEKLRLRGNGGGEAPTKNPLKRWLEVLLGLLVREDYVVSGLIFQMLENSERQCRVLDAEALVSKRNLRARTTLLEHKVEALEESPSR